MQHGARLLNRPGLIKMLQIVSSTLAGAALGSLSGGGLADTLGRRKSLLLAAVPMLVGPLLAANAHVLNTMIAGRFITGLAIGLSSAVVPTYISEVRRIGSSSGWAGLGVARDCPPGAVAAGCSCNG